MYAVLFFVIDWINNAFYISLFNDDHFFYSLAFCNERWIFIQFNKRFFFFDTDDKVNAASFSKLVHIHDVVAIAKQLSLIWISLLRQYLSSYHNDGSLIRWIWIFSAEKTLKKRCIVFDFVESREFKTKGVWISTLNCLNQTNKKCPCSWVI